jgi:FlaA1/EpsC-like NDP-sugar epimerase
VIVLLMSRLFRADDGTKQFTNDGQAGCMRSTKKNLQQLWTRMASRTVRMRADLATAGFDVVFSAVAYTLMLVLRYEGSVPSDAWASFAGFLPIAVVTVLLCNWWWGLYGQLWHHASMYEAKRLVLSGCTLTGVLLLAEGLPRHAPISVMVTGSLAATFLMALTRFQARLFSFRRVAAQPGLRVVVIGAGGAGASLVGEMLRNPRAGFQPVAIVDDDASLHGRSFQGVGVDGAIDDLAAVVQVTGAHLVVLAMSNPPHDVVRRAAEGAETADVPFKILPGIATTMQQGAGMRDLRDVNIEDLLGRPQVSTDLRAVGAMLAGRTVLITGAGGSIGSEIARQVAAFMPGRLVLLDHDETHLHDAAASIERPTVQVLADIRQRRQMLAVFAEHLPDVVFHAAAHKHVPLLEAHPGEAVRTNVVGTANVLECATSVGVQRLVLISTDKAVYPSSIMGASKRLGEQLLLSRSPAGSAYCAVRFGNVLGSRGSVVPTFLRQIQAGGPVTVTDRRMTRFFMSIPEAVQLVLQAGALASTDNGGEVFMLDMGEPVVIYELAERMIRLSGRKPGTDIEIRVTGMRPGEKLAEELKAMDELEAPTVHPSIMRVAPNSIDPDALEQGINQLIVLADALDDTRCASVLRNLAGPQTQHPIVSRVG